MHIIAVTNIKGGVGKTTTAVNLSYLAAAAGRATLLWDLDPQGAASWTLRAAGAPRASAKKLVHGKRELPELVVASDYPHLDVLPADFSYRHFDVHLSARKHPTERLLRMSAELREHYDCLVLDCPPGISLLTENVLHAADAAIVPIVPSPLSVRMLASLHEFIAREDWKDLKLLPFFSMVDRRRSLHTELIAETRARFAEVLATEIPYWSEIERMSVRRAPLPAYATESASAQLYRALLAEVLARVEGRTPAARPARGAAPGASGATRAAPDAAKPGEAAQPPAATRH